VIQSVTGVLGGDDEEDEESQGDTRAPGSATAEPASSSPDVNPDGSVSSTDDVDDDQYGIDTGGGRIRRALAGVTTSRHYQGECPNCEKWVRSRPSRGMSRCTVCGWRPGLPVLRRLTHRRWYRTKRRVKRWGTRLAVVPLAALVALFVIGAVGGVGVPMIDEPASDLSASAGIDGALNSSTGTPPATEASSSVGVVEGELDRSEIGREVHRYINKERSRRGLSTLSCDTRLQEIARYHSEDMASERYFAHDSPDGETLGDRYDRFGYDCRVQTSGNTYATGAENIAYTYADSNVRTESGLVNYGNNETDIARGLVSQWMNSTGHRENILRPFWESEGIGVAIEDVNGQTRVYATQNFC
jgi:uncharacterized protein YkwD/ribosomal protein L37AE/L43A